MTTNTTLFGFLLLLLLALLLPQNVVAADPAELIHPRIIFGTRVSAKDASIVKVRRVSSAGISICSGSVISPKFVLTAWHCVDRTRTRMSVVANGRKMAVQRVYVHPDLYFDPETELLHDDLALLKLRRPLNVPVLAILASRAVVEGDDLVIMGYGLDENGRIGALRQGTARADTTSADFIISVFEEAESNACYGDSGGPAILTYRDTLGVERAGIVGLTSMGSGPSCWYGDSTYFVNLQKQSTIDFITSKDPAASFL